MSERGYVRLSWGLFALTLGVLLTGLVLWTPDVELFLLFALISLPFAIVGFLAASRRTRNPVGWLFLVFALIAAFTASADRYAAFALDEHPGSLPGGEWVAWISTGVWHPAFGFFVFAFLLFPNGRLPSPRWRPVAWFAGLVYAVGAVVGLLWGPLFGEFYPDIEPPFRLPFYPAADAVFFVFIVCNFALLLLSSISLVLRMRKAEGIERQQLKWFVYAVALFALVFPTSVAYFGDGRIIVFLLPLVPVAAGIAILRYRLYDIDLVINRTLVYGSLSLSLGLIYAGSVISLQYALRALTGQNSTLVIVASTLVIAALFNPLRRRIQRLVDRRFYRQKYDAAKTLAGFSMKLRDEVDLDSLNGDLLSVLHGTVRPTHVSLWLRNKEERG